ncbi:hypothetical protein JCM10914A_20140 [Paenibacillus sp. JCM 10914]
MDAEAYYIPAQATSLEQAMGGQGYQGVETLVLGGMVMGRFADPSKQAPQQQTKNKGARRRVKIFLAIMALFLVWAGSTLWSQNDRIRNQNEALEQKQGEYKTVELSLNQIRHEVERLQDPEYIGQVARKKFRLYLPNETPIIQPHNSGEKP